MTRTAWIVLFLLLASNAAWVAVTLGGDESATDPFYERETLETQVHELQGEVDRLRADAEPAMPGLTGAGGTHPPASASEDASSGDPDTAPDASRAENEAAAEAAEAEHRARQKHQREVLEQVKATLAKVMQVKDPALRAEGLAELQAALQSTDATLVEYSLSALHALRTTEIDRRAFRGTVLDLLKSESAGIRRSALYALHATGAQPGDEALALAAASDEDALVRQHAARVLKLYTGGEFEGEAGSTLARLLRDETSDVRRGTLRALYGVTLSENVEKALIEVAANPQERYDAVHYGLSVAKDKSRGVIDALFTHLEDENVKVRARAHWGLQRSIPDESKPYVAKRYADHLEKFVNPKSHQEALKLIARFGDAGLVPQLDRFADNELVDSRVREMARKAAEYLRSK